MPGYTASGKSDSLDESKSPPSEYRKQVVNRKNSPIADTPDKKDECVYMDEFLSYLMGKAGSSESETGCKAYPLTMSLLCGSIPTVRCSVNPFPVKR